MDSVRATVTTSRVCFSWQMAAIRGDEPPLNYVTCKLGKVVARAYAKSGMLLFAAVEQKGTGAFNPLTP